MHLGLDLIDPRSSIRLFKLNLISKQKSNLAVFGYNERPKGFIYKLQSSRRCFNIRTHHLQNNTVEGRRQQENKISHQPKILDHGTDHTLPLCFGSCC